MQINKERFLALTAALAVGAMGTVVGCSSDSKSAAPGGGTGGGTDAGEGTGGKTSSSTGGKGGASSTDGGTPDASGSGGKAATDGGGTMDGSSDGGNVMGPCFGDSSPQIDAGGEGLTQCDLIQSDCVIPDAGGDTTLSTPWAACYTLDGVLRPGVETAFRECLQKIADPCAPAADDETAACLEAVAANSCEKPKADGAVDPCIKISTGCPDVALADCQAVMRSFTDDTVNLGILPCLEAAGPLDGGSCSDAFFACVPPSLE